MSDGDEVSVDVDFLTDPLAEEEEEEHGADHSGGGGGDGSSGGLFLVSAEDGLPARGVDGQGDDGGGGLAFQEIPHASSSHAEDRERLLGSDDGGGVDERSELKGSSGGDGDGGSGGGGGGILSLAFYQAYFNVTTEMILKRLVRSVLPLKRLLTDDDKPDLYGPFWVTTTLIFLMDASANVAAWLAHEGDGWEYDFNKQSVAAAVFYGYVTIAPLILWFLLPRTGLQVPLSTLLCLYGYSLTVFLPTAILCIVNVASMRWVLIGVSGLLSTAFLLRNTFAGAGEDIDNAQAAKFVAGLQVALQLVLALVMKLYFFRYVAVVKV